MFVRFLLAVTVAVAGLTLSATAQQPSAADCTLNQSSPLEMKAFNEMQLATDEGDRMSDRDYHQAGLVRAACAAAATGYPRQWDLYREGEDFFMAGAAMDSNGNYLYPNDTCKAASIFNALLADPALNAKLRAYMEHQRDTGGMPLSC